VLRLLPFVFLKKSAHDENGNNTRAASLPIGHAVHRLSRARFPLSPSNGLIVKNQGRTGTVFRTGAASQSTSYFNVDPGGASLASDHGLRQG